MKRYVCFMIIAAALFVGCGKKVDPTANNKVGIMNETVRDIDPTRVEISGTYSYLTSLDAIYVLVGTGNDMSGAMAFESVLSGKSFTADVTGLKENTNYYYRYRFVSMGTEQESEAVRSFTTIDYQVPEVTTAEVTEITGCSMKCGGEVTDDGYLEVTARGVCWSTSPNPTVSDSHTTDGSGTGVFTSTTSNLEPGVKYYIRAYATNSRGTGYGEVREFTTLDGDSDIYTGAISGITACSAVCDGSKVTDGGGLDVMDKGLCWAKHPDPTTADAKVSKGAGLGEFTVEMAGLEFGERYYVRAYSVNTKETKYGNEREFTTLDGKPVVTTSSVTNVMATTATCGGEVTDDGGFPVTERGVCWSKSTNPTVEGSHKTGGSGNGSFTVGIDNLEVDETYHVRSYAKNSHTTSYGNDVVFTTKDGTPAVTTSSVTNVMATTATCGGEVTGDGGLLVTERGVCWSKTANPTTEDSHKQSGSGTGSFTVNLDNLEVDETYHVRSYAKNSHTTSYGNDVVFTTKDGTPAVTTSSVTNVMATTATCGGEVTEDYGFSVTARGICWSTSPNPTVSNSHTIDGSDTGVFTSSITGLTEGTTYYVRAYATNAKGTGYGEVMEFTTPHQTFTVNGVTFEMVRVDGGTFTMGATSEQGSDAESDEKPTHSVTLGDYYIGKFEVTQELWLAVMGSWPGTAPSGSCGVGDDYPAYFVSWNDCQDFISRLNQLAGASFRLPTEAEWEYAARGGSESEGYKYSGSNSIDDVAWYSGNGGKKTHPVGTKTPNELGIYDMSGNVFEWCQDWYGSYGSGSQTNPQGPSSGSLRVSRGGSWDFDARQCRVSNRSYNTPDSRYGGLGFRLAVSQ